jgi:hypothetical protein
MSRGSVDIFALMIKKLNEPEPLCMLIAFVKNEGNNLTTMASTSCSIIDFQSLSLIKVYKGTCFGHVMFKAC